MRIQISQNLFDICDLLVLKVKSVSLSSDCSSDLDFIMHNGNLAQIYHPFHTLFCCTRMAFVSWFTCVDFTLHNMNTVCNTVYPINSIFRKLLHVYESEFRCVTLKLVCTVILQAGESSKEKESEAAKEHQKIRLQFQKCKDALLVSQRDGKQVRAKYAQLKGRHEKEVGGLRKELRACQEKLQEAENTLQEDLEVCLPLILIVPSCHNPVLITTHLLSYGIDGINSLC